MTCPKSYRKLVKEAEVHPDRSTLHFSPPAEAESKCLKSLEYHKYADEMMVTQHQGTEQVLGKGVLALKKQGSQQRGKGETEADKMEGGRIGQQEIWSRNGPPLSTIPSEWKQFHFRLI